MDLIMNQSYKNFIMTIFKIGNFFFLNQIIIFILLIYLLIEFIYFIYNLFLYFINLLF
jgi:hypothetical protein